MKLQTVYPSPNMRKMMIPDEGYTICGMDLDRADLQVVAWDSGEPTMKKKLRSGLDIHTLNAQDIFQVAYEDVAKSQRDMAKMACHAMNYYIRPRTLAIKLGVKVKRAEEIMETWFAANPKIAEWQEIVKGEAFRTRRIKNAFGYQTIILSDLTNKTVSEALAWIPQSTVGLVIQRAMINLHEECPEVELLLQVHDELIFQFKGDPYEVLPKVRELSLIEIPYEDPLTIPVGFKISQKSWGELEEIEI